MPNQWVTGNLILYSLFVIIFQLCKKDKPHCIWQFNNFIGKGMDIATFPKMMSNYWVLLDYGDALRPSLTFIADPTN